MTLKRILLVYKRYKAIVKIVAAIIGVIAGVSACGLFGKKYHNYHAAGWAAFSALCALYFLHIVFTVRRDVQEHSAAAGPEAVGRGAAAIVARRVLPLVLQPQQV